MEAKKLMPTEPVSIRSATSSAAVRVLPEHQPAESELGVVRQRDGLVNTAIGVVVFQDAQDRAEDLLAGDPHLRGDVGEDCGLHEIAALKATA